MGMVKRYAEEKYGEDWVHVLEDKEYREAIEQWEREEQEKKDAKD